MSLLNFIDQLGISPTVAIVSLERKIKICQGCQETELETKRSLYGDWIIELSYNHEDYKHRVDITKWDTCPHEFGLLHKAGLYVWHTSNHEQCYNYKLDTIERVFELSANKAESPTEITPILHICPGHCEVLAHYTKSRNAEREASDEVTRLKKEANIKTATYTILKKGSQDSKKYKCFEWHKNFYTYAALITHYHYDGSTKCFYHPNFTATTYISKKS